MADRSHQTETASRQAAVPVQVKLYTMCLVRDGERVLLLKRRDKQGNEEYVAPGGKLELAESWTDGAIREVKEETGLTVRDLVYKGVEEYVNEETNTREMVLNYVTDTFEGELCGIEREGEPVWVPAADVQTLPMQDWFRRRFPLFGEEGTFEIYTARDAAKEDAWTVRLRRT